MRELNVTVFADYFQIWMVDKSREIIERSFIFTDQHLADRMWIEPGMIGMFTERNFTVPLNIQIHQHAPDDDFGQWDHVAEASLSVASGTIEIEGLNDFMTIQFHMRPSDYRVRMYQGSLGQLSENGLEGPDHYRIAVWPESPTEPIVLKRWESKHQ